MDRPMPTEASWRYLPKVERHRRSNAELAISGSRIARIVSGMFVLSEPADAVDVS